MADGIALNDDGTVLIVITGVAAVVFPQVFVAVSVYTPAEAVDVTIAAGLPTEAVYPLGPFHK